MNRISNEHRRRNADSRDRWECFATHRRKVTELLMASHAEGQGRLCLLGAGNCNDLDLTALTKVYSEVHLVDLDQEAVTSGVASQGLVDTNRVRVHGDMDLAGCNEIVSDWTLGRLPTDTDVQQCIDAVSSFPVPQVPGPFDVIASVCLLTQLFDSVSISLGGEHPRFLELLTCIRLRHVRLLFELLQPGGTAILITDFVSSSTFPPLANTSERDLPGLAAKLVNSRNFFTGTNPAVLQALFKTDAVIGPQVSHLEVAGPWLWDFGPRVYAVFAITSQKHASD
ncbi:MAG TPA: hypothetical protein QF564_01300 [Pirellulaceae bacterium]|nr:hypothetical protein [Pirellulaceae bacterium]